MLAVLIEVQGKIDSLYVGPSTSVIEFIVRFTQRAYNNGVHVKITPLNTNCLDPERP